MFDSEDIKLLGMGILMAASYAVSASELGEFTNVVPLAVVTSVHWMVAGVDPCRGALKMGVSSPGVGTGGVAAAIAVGAS